MVLIGRWPFWNARTTISSNYELISSMTWFGGNVESISDFSALNFVSRRRAVINLQSHTNSYGLWGLVKYFWIWLMKVMSEVTKELVILCLTIIARNLFLLKTHKSYFFYLFYKNFKNLAKRLKILREISVQSHFTKKKHYIFSQKMSFSSRKQDISDIKSRFYQDCKNIFSKTAIFMREFGNVWKNSVN